MREALKALDSLGIVESRHGDGVYVKAFSFDAIVDNLPYAMAMSDEQVRSLLYTRSYLELGAIPDLVKVISDAEVARLHELGLAMLARARRGELFPEEDRAFHVEMYRCLGNAFLNSLIDLFWKTFNKMSEQNQDAVDSALLEARARDHLYIAEMLAQRDVFGLLSAHRRHFDYLFRRFPIAAPETADQTPAIAARAARPTDTAD
jgi:DNA-binding FadR family transcriptional regulator